MRSLSCPSKSHKPALACKIKVFVILFFGASFYMSLTVVGSVAFDALETPFGKRDKILGGAGTHFSLSASYFTDVRAVGVVGGDFGDEEWAVFRRHNINTDDI